MDSKKKEEFWETKKIKIIFIAILFVIISGIFYVTLTKDSNKKRCSWVITNCCTENAGAFWECVDLKTYKPRIDCSKILVVCPQVLSPKPNLQCIYDGEIKECVVR